MADPGSGRSFQQSGSDLVPVPDPTELTTAAVDRATRQWDRQLNAEIRIIGARLDAIDTATRLRLEAVDAIKPDTERQVGHLRGLHDQRFEAMVEELHALREYILGEIRAAGAVSNERFEAVNARFAERDTRDKQTAEERRISLDAALAAAKEAVSEQNKANALAIGKSEAATQKQIDSQTALALTNYQSLQDKIDDLKNRVTIAEGRQGGVAEAIVEQRSARVETHAATSSSQQWIGIAIGLGGLLLALIVAYLATKK